jgi:hypothetical protein
MFVAMATKLDKTQVTSEPRKKKTATTAEFTLSHALAATQFFLEAYGRLGFKQVSGVVHKINRLRTGHATKAEAALVSAEQHKGLPAVHQTMTWYSRVLRNEDQQQYPQSATAREAIALAWFYPSYVQCVNLFATGDREIERLYYELYKRPVGKREARTCAMQLIAAASDDEGGYNVVRKHVQVGEVITKFVTVDAWLVVS